MIDTWARHVAALREARRLTAMILANNPAFAALHGRGASDDRTVAELQSALGGDRIYEAYGHLSAALALLEPAKCEPSVLGLNAVTLLPAPAEVQAPPAGFVDAVALFMPDETPGGRAMDEACVAIVCREPSPGPQMFAPARSNTQTRDPVRLMRLLAHR